MIPEVDAVTTEVEDNVLNADTAIGLDTLVIDAISYMADLLVLLIWLSSDHSACSSSVSGSSSTPEGVILTPSEYEEYLRLTQAAKISSIASVAQTGNVSACLTHSSAPWILDTGAFDHISGNKDIFSSLTFPSPLLTITLANGSQTIAKGIGLVYPHPSLPPLPLYFMFLIFLLILFPLIS